MQTLTIPIADDFHLHLRQDEMMRSIVPLIRGGGVGRCVVMPNTTQPIAVTADAMRYRDELRTIDPGIEFMMTL